MLSIKLLKQAKLKVTPARVAILQILDGSPPISAQDIVDRLSQNNQAADPVTVYRSLDQFVASNIVKQINFNEGKFRYELAGDHHHHLVCQTCNKVIPIEDCDIEDKVKQQASKYKFDITSHTLEFFGLCRQCQS